jgi:hypothetical protein
VRSPVRNAKEGGIRITTGRKFSPRDIKVGKPGIKKLYKNITVKPFTRAAARKPIMADTILDWAMKK